MGSTKNNKRPLHPFLLPLPFTYLPNPCSTLSNDSISSTRLGPSLTTADENKEEEEEEVVPYLTTGGEEEEVRVVVVVVVVAGVLGVVVVVVVVGRLNTGSSDPCWCWSIG